MADKKRPSRRASYLKDFQCIGGICEDNCCIGWDVEIDERSYNKYQKLKDRELSKLIHKYIYENEDSYDRNVDFARVELAKNNRCPFLNEQHLCKIQAKLGEHFLSNVCATYPRYANEINGVVEYSATISCPEAARLILKSEQGLRFEEEREDTTARRIINYTVNTKDHGGSPMVKYFLQLRDLSISVLQNRTYRLWERIYLVGIFYHEFQMAMDHGNHNIPKLIETFHKKLNQGFLKEDLSKVAKDPTLQLKIMKEITDKRNTRTEIDSERYLAFTEEFFKGVGISSKPNLERESESYQLSYEKYFEPFMKEKEYMLENYLVNFVFEDLFPAAESTQPFEAYMMLVVRYALIKAHLIGIAAFRKGLSEAVCIQFIQVFSKGIEHHHTYLDEIKAYMNRKKYQSLKYMGILLKN